MVNERKRILELFFILTEHCDDYINSNALAEKVNVSDRTIKSDIKDLERFALASGSHIEAKKGHGYRLIIDDRQKFEPVREQLQFYFGMFGSIQAMRRTRVNDIVRRIICEENYMTLDEIADELYLTRSALREDNKEVRKFLAQFNLRLKNNYETGPLVVGSEYDRRLAMLCVFENHYHEAMTFYKNFDYLQWFDFDEEQRYDIRHIFLRHLRESKCHIRDDHTQRLSRYLCLMANRYQKGYKVVFDDNQMAFIRSFRQYEVTKDMMAEIADKYHIFVDDGEICGFALQLLCWNDIDHMSNDDLKADYKMIYNESQELVNYFIKSIIFDYNIDLTKITEAKDRLIKGMIPMIIQLKFGLGNQSIRNVISEDDRIRYYPMGMYLAYNIDEIFYNKYNRHISAYNIVTYAGIIETLILNISYPFKPIKGIISIVEGLNQGNFVKALIERRYQGCFECLDVFELYEMRKLKSEDYDYAIINYPEFSYKYAWPYLMIDIIPTQHQLNQIYNKIILNGVQLNEILAKLNIIKCDIYKDFVLINYDYFVDLISFRHAKDSKSINCIKEELQRIETSFIHNKTMILMVKRKYTTDNFIEFYDLAEEHEYRDCNFMHIVVMSVDFANDIACLRFINDLMFMLYQDERNIIKIINQGNIQGLTEIVRESLKMLPISLK